MSETIPHTLSDFDDGLRELRESVLVMASIASQNVRNAVEGILRRDDDLCNRAISDDAEVDSCELRVDEDGIEILIRFNPVATDLRVVASAMKISTNLERISDEAEHMARRGRKMLKRSAIEETSLLEPVAQLATELLDGVIRAYAEGDVDLAIELIEKNKKLDKTHRSTIKKLTHRMEEDAENIRSYLNLIFACRCLERIGDHAVNIAEDVVYIHRGESIRHLGPEALEA